MAEVVVVLGASKDPARYSYKAIEMLLDYGHRPIPVHPQEKEIKGLKVSSSLKDLIGQKVDTVTVYVKPSLSSPYLEDLIKLAPRRVIFNPGAENPELERELVQKGINVENACTLVLLRTAQFNFK